MSAFFDKISGKLSDLKLDLELFIARFSRKKPVVVETKGLGSIVAREKPITESVPLNLRLTHLSGSDRFFFFDQMATLVGSGVTLIDSLSILQAQARSKSQKRLYAEMVHRINAGLTMADTMELFPYAFAPMQKALVEAGEKSGNLKTVFIRIAEDLESQLEFMHKIKGAMFYPLIVLGLALVMVTGMIVFVIPKVSKLYEQSNAKLPSLTQAVIDLSRIVGAHYPIMIGLLVGVVSFIWVFTHKTHVGKWAKEAFVSAMPVFGRLSKEKNLLLFSSSLAMLLDSGVLIGDAFAITEKTVDNLHFQKSLAEIRHGVILGKSVSEMMGLKDLRSQTFTEHKLFPLPVAQMVRIGEHTGNMAKMLGKVRQNYQKSIDYTLKNMSTMVEPLMIFFVALLVGSILLAVMLPFFYIGSTIH
jgi:type IV pilus assembly protein PilC